MLQCLSAAPMCSEQTAAVPVPVLQKHAQRAPASSAYAAGNVDILLLQLSIFLFIKETACVLTFFPIICTVDHPPLKGLRRSPPLPHPPPPCVAALGPSKASSPVQLLGHTTKNVSGPHLSCLPCLPCLKEQQHRQRPHSVSRRLYCGIAIHSYLSGLFCATCSLTRLS